jgi:alpha 1,2-mannosyltransferase
MLPIQLHNKFSFKVAGMFLSSFDEFIFLDADNNVLKGPTCLFDTDLYKRHNALFWYDFWHLDKNAECFNVLKRINSNITDITLFEQESGQMVISKTKYRFQIWTILRILENTNNLCRYFPGVFNHGDKDIFHTTWLAHNKPYDFIPYRTGSLGSFETNETHFRGTAMVQHDSDGDILFVHQNFNEWGQRTQQFTPLWNIYKQFTHPIKGKVVSGTWNLRGALVKSILFTDIFPKKEKEFFELSRIIKNDISRYFH